MTYATSDPKVGTAPEVGWIGVEWNGVGWGGVKCGEVGLRCWVGLGSFGTLQLG